MVPWALPFFGLVTDRIFVLVTDRPRQELQGTREMLIAVERAASMCRPVDDVERDVEPKLLVRTHQLVCLVDGHLRVLIPMQKEERRVAAVDLENRTGKLSQILYLVG
jgi:hypothetical protein